ncbi:MAG: DinB family protein [Ktedonobacteraceae bacterium]
MSQTEHQLSLSLFYKGWDVYQQRLVAAIAPLSPEQLALRASPQQWSVGMLATHIVSARAWWFHTRMGEGSADLAPLCEWDLWEEREVPIRSAAELVAGLERTWQMIQDALARWTPADLEQVFPQYNEESPARSRQYIIWHVLEHDIHHGGELSSILGAHGLAAVDLG